MVRPTSSTRPPSHHPGRCVLVATPRLELVLVDAEELAAIRDGRRDGRRWAADYPTPGDRLVARLALGGRDPLPTPSEPWGLLQVVLRADGTAIGGIGSKGRPVGGEVEIGYGLAPSVQGRGFATEALGALVGVARVRGLRALIAETDESNAASRRVLEKNGFHETRREEASVWWRLDLAAERPRCDTDAGGLSGA